MSDPGTKSQRDRRSVPRYPFVGCAEITNPLSQARVVGQISMLGLNGCYIETPDPFLPKTVVQLVIGHGKTTFTTWAMVLYSDAGRGMGLRFMSPETDQAIVLAAWIVEAGKAVTSVCNSDRRD